MVSNTERITTLEAEVANIREESEATRQQNALQFEELKKAINNLKVAKSVSEIFSDEEDFHSVGRKKSHDEDKIRGPLREYRKLKMPVCKGNDAHGWIYRVERYFEVEGIEGRNRLRKSSNLYGGPDIILVPMDRRENPVPIMGEFEEETTRTFSTTLCHGPASTNNSLMSAKTVQPGST